MDFDLALECVDPTTRRGDGENAWTPARAACKLCGGEQLDPRDAPCCGTTLCAVCIVSSAAAGATGELRCPSCNSDGDYYVAYAAAFGARRPVRALQVSEDDEVARLRQELAEAKAGLKRAERETTQPAKRRRAAPAAVPAAVPPVDAAEAFTGPARPPAVTPQQSRLEHATPTDAVVTSRPTCGANDWRVVGAHVEDVSDSSVRGVITDCPNAGWREVTTTTGSVLMIRPAKLTRTTLTPDEAARAVRPTSRKDYVQARIDGAIRLSHGGREFMNRYSTADGTERRQFEVTATHIRCALCPDARTWSFETDKPLTLKDTIRSLKGHCESSDRRSRVHLERLLAAATGQSLPSSTICHMSGALTSSTFSGYWSLAADGPRGSFRLDVIQDDVSGDARQVRLRGAFLDRQAGTVADSMQLTLANDGSILGSGCSDFGDYEVVGTHANNTLSLRKTPPRARVERTAPNGIPHANSKAIEMRRVGDLSNGPWRRFNSQTDAANAFGLYPSEVSYLVNDRSKATAPSRRFEARRVAYEPATMDAEPMLAPAPAASSPAVGDRVVLILDNVEGVVTACSRPGWFMVDLDGYDSAIEFEASELRVLSPAPESRPDAAAAPAAPVSAGTPLVVRATPPAAPAPAATPAPPTVAPSTRIVRGTGDASAPLELASSDDERTPAPAAARTATSVGERRAIILRVFEHAVTCGGRCGKPACAAMRTHIRHRNQTAGQCHCTVCRGIETCVVLHARRCRSPTCPISACARRRLQDAQAAAAAPAPARLPPPATAERATTSGSYAPGPQSHLFRR